MGRVIVQELCESRGGRPGLPSLINPMVSVDVKQHFNNMGGRTKFRILLVEVSL